MSPDTNPTRRAALVAVALVAFVVLLVLLPVIPENESASVTLDTATPPEQAQNIDLLGETATPESNSAEAANEARPPRSDRNKDAMKITVPKLGLKDVAVPSGSTQERLDREGLLRLSESGVPWREGSNTFIAGHTLGYDDTRVPYAFFDLDGMKPGDEILIKDSTGKRYVFRVFDRMVVQPSDYWVTYPDSDGRTLVSLQACVPAPTFEDRLIVRAELVS